MVDIMLHMHKYVPTLSTTVNLEVEGEADMQARADYFHPIPFGGDQLTVARARGAQNIRENSLYGMEQLQGLLPVCKDWHARVVLLSVLLMFTYVNCNLPYLISGYMETPVPPAFQQRWWYSGSTEEPHEKKVTSMQVMIS